jgi:dihydrofolate reductase
LDSQRFFIYLQKIQINKIFIMTKFKIIACINKKGAIGKEGKLIYRIGNDLANFKAMTSYNGVVVMGRRTYESLPNGEPLKNRINIVITANENFGIDQKFDNVYIVNSVEGAVELCDAFFSDKEVFIIGGESIYRQFMEKDLVDEMRLTVVNDEADGDVYFPEFNEDDWYQYYKSMAQVSSYNGIDRSFYYEIYTRKK